MALGDGISSSKMLVSNLLNLPGTNAWYPTDRVKVKALSGIS